MKDIKFKRSHLLPIILNFLIFFIAVYMLVYANNNSHPVFEKWSAESFYLSIITIILNLYAFHKYRVNIYSFQFVMMGLTYLFMYGRIWLNFLGMDKNIFWPLHKMFAESNVRLTGILAVCFTQALFLGLILSYNYTPKKNTCFSDRRFSDYSLYTTGILLICIGLPCRIITDIRVIATILPTGNFTSMVYPSGLIDDLAYFLIPGLLCIFEVNRKYSKQIFIILLAYFIVIISITGDRRYYVSAILALSMYLIELWKTSDHKFRPKNKTHWLYTILLVYAGLVFLNFLEVIRKIRAGNLTSFSQFVVSYGEDIFDISNILFDVLAEFGITFFSLVAIVTNVPGIVDFQYGMTFVKTIPSILPVGSIFYDMFQSASPSGAINSHINLPVGATFFGDLYANFWYFGIPVMFIAGLLLGIIFSNKKKMNSKFSKVMYYTHFYILINLVRCTFFEIFRPMIWCTFIPWIIIELVSNNYNRAKESNCI